MSDDTVLLPRAVRKDGASPGQRSDGADGTGTGTGTEGEDAGRVVGKITLREIAEAASVSISTASRALSGAPGISAAVRSRVQNAAERLSYAPTNAAGTTLTIIGDLNLAESGAGDFVQAIMRGIDREARELGFTLSLTLLVPGGTTAFELQGTPAGCLLISMQDESVIQALHEKGLPAVIVNGRERLMRLDTVAPANRTGGYLAARHLLDLGHRRVLMLTYSPRPTIRDRAAGYMAAMHEAGVIVPENLIVELDAMRTDVAYAATKARLTRPDRADFTAIHCCNDSSAIGAMTAVWEAGLRIPEDISIIGFDDIPTAAMTRCPLTTIRVEAEEIGAQGVRRLFARIKNPTAIATYTEFAVQLVVRDSTGRPPGG